MGVVDDYLIEHTRWYDEDIKRAEGTQGGKIEKGKDRNVLG